MQKKKQSKKTNNTFTLIFLTSLIFIGCAVPQKNVKVGKIDDTGKSKSYEYFYQEGLKELNSKQYERAIELFSKSISLNQSDPKVLLQRGIAFYKKGEYEQSSSDLKQVLTNEPDKYEAKKWLGKIQFLRGNFDEAFSYFKDLHEKKNLKDEEDFKWYGLISDAAYKFHRDEAESDIQDDDVDNAISELNLCRSIKSQEPDPVCKLCELYFSGGKPWQSAKELRDYTGENQPCILYHKSLAYYRLADFQSSSEALKALKENFKENRLIDDLTTKLREEEKSETIKRYKEISSSSQFCRSDFALLTVLRIFPYKTPKSEESVIVTDIADNTLKKYINLVIEMGTMPVYPNHTFKPDKVLNRWEFAILIDSLLKKIGINPDDFINTSPVVVCNDLPMESSYYNAAQNILRMKLIYPFEDHTFKGEENITGKDAISCFDKLGKFLSKK